jgi:arsenate reductase (thioredoxin)
MQPDGGLAPGPDRGGRVHVRSAGSDPADQINPNVVRAMSELGVDIGKEFPKPMTDEMVQAADAVITMGCGDACLIYSPGRPLARSEMLTSPVRTLSTTCPLRSRRRR